MSTSQFSRAMFVAAMLITFPGLAPGQGVKVVSTHADSGPGSLRDTISAAASGDTIIFSITGAITLTSGELFIDKNLTINGPGPANLAITRSSAAGTPDFRIFRLGSNGANRLINISGLTISNGRGTNSGTFSNYIVGGAILANHSAATLTLDNCVVSGNTTTSLPDGSTPAMGGAIYSEYNVITAHNCTFANNVALGSNSTVIDAPNGNNAEGGAVAVGGGELDCTGCAFTGNSAIAGNGVNGRSASGNGGFAVGGAVTGIGTLSNCTFTNNIAQGGNGFTAGTTRNSGNGGDASGGALDFAGTIIECTFISNGATPGAAGGGPHPGIAGRGSAGGLVVLGAGLPSGTLVTGCTFTNNGSQYGGAISCRYDPTTIRNCTFSGNAGNQGGVIYNDYQSMLTLENCTISAQANGGGGIYNNTDGVNGSLHLANTILKSDNTPANNNILGNIFVSLGHNISNDAAGGDGSTAPGGYLTGAGDLRNTNPQLIDSTPGDHGGPTPTFALYFFSPAVNYGDDNFALRRDQRGYFRAGRSDVGAFENQGGLIGNIVAITRTPNASDITIGFEAVDRLTYRLQRKLNITDANWQDVDPNGNHDVTATSNDVFSLTAAGDIGLGKAFYRVTWVSGP